MNKTEFKNVIKEAILELVNEGKIQLVAPNQNSLSNSGTSIRKSSNQLAEMIRSNANHLSERGGKASGDAALLNLLADTAQTTYAKQEETKKFGITSEEKERFDSMFPDQLIETFHKMFDKG